MARAVLHDVERHNSPPIPLAQYRSMMTRGRSHAERSIPPNDALAHRGTMCGPPGPRIDSQRSVWAANAKAKT
jgi:hypothetical protein